MTVRLGSLLAAGAALAVAYRLGITQAAWRDAHDTRRALRQDRRTAWAHTFRLAAGALLVLLGLTAAAFGLAR